MSRELQHQIGTALNRFFTGFYFTTGGIAALILFKYLIGFKL